MNPGALPTPFDITPPPLVAYVPGAIEWIAFSVCGVILILLAILYRIRTPQLSFTPYSECLRELKSINPNEATAYLQIQHCLKNLLSEVNSIDLRAWTAREIQLKTKMFPDILRICKNIEETLYKKTSSVADARDILTLAIQAVNSAHNQAIVEQQQSLKP